MKTCLIAVLTLLTALIFALDLTPWVRGGFGWRWEYAPVSFERLIPLILCLLIDLTGAWLLLQRTQRAVHALLWGLTGTVLLSFAVAYAREGDALYFLFTRTVSNTASAEWWMGASIDWQAGQWRDWTGIMASLGQRTSNAATSPPGMPMLYSLTTDLFNRFPGLSQSASQTLLPYQCHNYELLAFTPSEWASAWFGMLTPLWAGLSVFPIYAITRRLYPQGDARLAVLWWALVPGILAFATSSSTVFPLIALWVFYFLLRGLDAHPAWLILAGFLYGVGLFLNFIFLPLAALYGFYTLLHYWFADRPKGMHWTRPLIVGLWFGLGAVIPWLIFFMLTGQTFFQMLAQSLDTHLDLERPYTYWVWMHLWDWMIWTGFAFALVWLLSLIQRKSHSSPLIPHPFLSPALLLTLLALTLSGTTRGESGRIWLALSPFALIAAGSLSRKDWLFPTLAQAVFILVLAGVLAVHNAPDLSRPVPPASVEVSHAIDATFSTKAGAVYRLTGWDADVDNASITLSLQWQGIQRPLEYQWFSAILVSPDGVTYPVEAWQPGGDTPYPTTCWSPETTVGDTVTLPLPENPASGGWYISLSAFGGGALEDGRLQVTLPDGSSDGQIGLGPVQVGAVRERQPPN